MGQNVCSTTFVSAIILSCSCPVNLFNVKLKFHPAKFSEGKIPSEEFELKANSLGARGKLVLRTLSYLTVNSQDDSH